MSVTTATTLVFCVGDTGSGVKDGGGVDGTTDALQPSDAGLDVTPPLQGFTLMVTPANVVADRGDSNIQVAVNVVRAASFSDDVMFTITSPTELTATTPPNTGAGGTSSSFTLSVPQNATLGDFSVLLAAQNPTKTFTANASLGVHIGSLVTLTDGGFTVPSYAHAIVVKAWGAGGGGAACVGNGCTLGDAGGFGGAGGYVQATVDVTPGTALAVLAGTGGGGGAYAGADPCAAGGGGGFSGVRIQNGSYLVVAGGGGGGAAYSLFGTAGGAGGGTTGQDGYGSATCGGGTGGTQFDGGATPSSCNNPKGQGTAFQGGAGFVNSGTCTGTQGAPGGGPGGDDLGGGGGGGGYWGGGGGGENSGGGGGSGWFAGDAGKLLTGNRWLPVQTSDPDFALCTAGAASGGSTPTAGSSAGGSGGPGCVVVRFAKP
jgi:hypothetical protein